MFPLDTSVQAEYADGYVHDETEHGDVSPFNPSQNILRDILEKRPEAEHGRMVRFSIFYLNNRYDIDWRGLPDNARPIRFRHGYVTLQQEQIVDKGWSGIDFGYQYNDENGKHVQKVTKL